MILSSDCTFEKCNPAENLKKGLFIGQSIVSAAPERLQGDVTCFSHRIKSFGSEVYY